MWIIPVVIRSTAIAVSSNPIILDITIDPVFPIFWNMGREYLRIINARTNTSITATTTISLENMSIPALLK